MDIEILPYMQARIQRGTGVRTPLRFVRGGVLCKGLMGRRGGPTVVLTLFSSFFLARFARQYHTNILHVCTRQSSM